MIKATIHYHDIGDYLDQAQKLAIIAKFKTMANPDMPFTILAPNEHGDWLAQRNDLFGTYVALGDKDSDKLMAYFNAVYSRGLATARDSWCYSFSGTKLKSNIVTIIDFYNAQRIAYYEDKSKNNDIDLEDFLTYDSTKVTWNRGFKLDILRNKSFILSEKHVYKSIYRPFCKQIVYFSRELNDMTYQLPKLFPTTTTANRVICVSCVGSTKGLSVLMSEHIPDLHFNGDTQCFPLYYYEERAKQAPSLFDQEPGGSEYIQRDGISDFILGRAREQYGPNITKEDVFYYVYGLLHEPSYRETFANDLKKMLPRLPLIESVPDFWAFSKAGRTLADLHIGYEQVPPHAAVQVTGEEYNNFRVDKMKFLAKDQKHCIIYNTHIHINNIPAEAYDYIVNGKSAIEWIIERYQITTHKESQIVNDPNDWAAEVGNPRYILDLLLSVIEVSVRTVEVVRGLPGVVWG
jgi:predicted helicase